MQNCEEPLATAQNVVVIGAGPAGLTAAYELTKKNIPTIVLEKDDIVGGIARTVCYKGYRFDIGGHRFFTKVKCVDDIWHEVLPRDFLAVKRLSRIFYDRKFFYYPIQPFNVLKGLGLVNSLLFGTSYLYAQIFPKKPEHTFERWVSNRFGKRLYKAFFKTYTEKVWGISCSEIRAEWAAQRIKGLSLWSAAKNALLPQKSNGKGDVIKTLIDQFHYPRLGPGMMWERMAELIVEGGNQVQRNANLQKIYWRGNRVTEVEVNRAGKIEKLSGSHFISSMPIRELIHKLSPAPDRSLIEAADGLSYRDFLVVALVIDKAEIFPDNWIYIHDSSVRLGRVQNFKNWSLDMVPDQSKTCLGLEYFCFVGDDLWTMPDEELVNLGKRELEKIGLAKAADVEDGTVVRMPKAYPVYDSKYRQMLDAIRQFLEPFTNLQLVGRNGMHKYNNQDHSMLTAILAAHNIMGANFDLWDVNVEQEYHEETHNDPRREEMFAQLCSTQPKVPIRSAMDGG